MNKFDAQARMMKHQQQLRQAMSPSDNPYHQHHIEEFTNYVDASVKSLAFELNKALPAMIDERIAKSKVQLDVDEPSMKKVKAKINELFSSFGRWGK